MSVVKRKYIPDLSGYMAQCELNYALVMRCMQALDNPSVFKEIQAKFRPNRSLSSQENTSVVKSSVSNNTEVDELQTGDPQTEDPQVVEPLLVTIIDEARYTTTVKLKLNLSESSWIDDICLTVRLYHDAQMAEVIEDNRNYTPKPNNRYPTQVRHYRDDKMQRNTLLRQFLNYCFSDSSHKICRPVITAS